MRNSLKREIKDILDELRRQGWRVEKRKHWVLYPSDKTKRVMTISQSPSDGRRALLNIKSELRHQGAII